MVLSTISGMPASLAIAETASRSETTPPGLARLSRNRARVLSVIAARKFSGSSLSTKVVFQPKARLKLLPIWLMEPP